MSRRSHKNGKGIVTVFLMVLALIFAFSFIGCANGTASAALEDDGNGDGDGKTPGGGLGNIPQIPPGQTAEQWASSLQSTLTDEVAEVVNKTTVKLLVDVTITKAGTAFAYRAAGDDVSGFAIHPQGTLIVPPGKTLTVASGGALNTVGTLQLEADNSEGGGGKLVVSGGTTAVTGSGTIEAAKNATLTVSNGTLTVAQGATVEQAEASTITVSGGSLTIQGTVQGAGTGDSQSNVSITVSESGSLSVATTAAITGKEVAIDAGGRSVTIEGATINGTEKVDIKVSVANAEVAATIESKEVVVTAAAAGVTVTGTVTADKLELAQEADATIKVDASADITVGEALKLTSGEDGTAIEINTDIKVSEDNTEGLKVEADVPPTGTGSLPFTADPISGATTGYLAKNTSGSTTSYYIYVATVADEESHYKGPLSSTPAEIAAKLDAANPDKLGYFDLRVTDASTLVTDTEGVVLVSSRIEAGTSSNRNVVIIPPFGNNSNFADGTALAAAVPVYIEDYAESAVPEYGENSTIEVQGGAFVFIPFRDTASYAKDYGKQNYKGIVLVKAGGALLDQGGAGFSIGPAGYWFDYNSIALIQSYASWNKGEGYNAFKLYVGSGTGGGNTDTNGLWIAPDGFKLGILTVQTAYGVWNKTDVSQVNGSGSFVWVAGSTFGVNGHLTIARDFALSQDLKILPNSKVTVAGMLMLGYDTGISDHSIVPIELSDAEMAPLDLIGGATGGQQLILNQGKAIVGHDYKSNAPTEKVVAVGTSDPTTYVPGTGPTGYTDVFPWDVQGQD